jgi:hypothetical protein
MNNNEFITYQTACFEKMQALFKSKNHDYTASQTDTFANFKIIEQYGINPEVGFLTRMSDKMSRVASFVSSGVLLVDNEKVEDTLLDLANYAILMAGYIKSKREG